jgi:DNA polymerase III epsilon subunit-like protein
MSGYVIYVIDTETTGLVSECDVIEISANRLSFDNNSEVKSEQKTWLLKALNPKTITDEALAVNGHKREDILHLTKFGKENYKDPAEVIADFELWIMEDNVSVMDRVFAGQNPNFDITMLQALWSRLDSLNTFPFNVERGNRVLDTKQLVLFFDICTEKRRNYYNLASLVKSFGAKKRKAHSASEDVLMTSELLSNLISPVKSTIAEKFINCYLDKEE